MFFSCTPVSLQMIEKELEFHNFLCFWLIFLQVRDGVLGVEGTDLEDINVSKGRDSPPHNHIN
jgi:hypothetical protein